MKDLDNSAFASNTTSQNENGTDVVVAAREAIDNIATIRARMTASAYLAHQVLSPLPGDTNNADKLLSHVAELERHMVAISEIHERLAKKAFGADASAQIDIVLHDVANKAPNFVRRLGNLRDATAFLHSAAANFVETDRPDVAGLNDAIDKHSEAREGMFDEVTRFCTDLWAIFDQSRAEQARLAAETNTMVRETLLKLSRIGKHVKLVSLNAAVEASRAGEDGKGLAVIAVEFKTLAEEIQKLAASAHSKS